MRTEKAIRKEIDRCTKERDSYKATSQNWDLYNARLWALKWVLEDDQ